MYLAECRLRSSVIRDRHRQRASLNPLTLNLLQPPRHHHDSLTAAFNAPYLARDIRMNINLPPALTHH